MPKKKTNDQDLIFNNKKETEMKSKKPINKIDPYDREMNFMIDQEFHKLINDLLSKKQHSSNSKLTFASFTLFWALFTYMRASVALCRPTSGTFTIQIHARCRIRNF